MKIYENSVLQAALTYSYAGGGCTPTSIAESVYDSSGNVTETAQITLDADGNSASAVVRDASNNIISSMTSQISNGVVTRLNSYDASNNLTAYVIYQYDSSNRVTRADTYTGAGLLQGTVFYQYNPNGVTLTESVSPGSTPEAISYTASFTYDGSGRVTSASISAGGVLQESESYTYTASGQIATMSLYDGTGTLQDSISCAYDGSGKLSGMTVTTPMSSGTVAITYDANGNLTDENTSTTVMSMYTITMDIQTTWAAY
jgi:antitoxin component YwqK of YwqJK toxin-antitoxin module